MSDPNEAAHGSPQNLDPDEPQGVDSGAAAVDPDDPSGPAPRPSTPSPEGSVALGEAGSMLSQAMVGLARVVLRRGRAGARRAASSGRIRLDLRQLRRDRDVMYQKLGREVRHLVEGGEVSHPGLSRGVERIRELEEQIAAVEADLAEQRAAEVAAGVSQGASVTDEISQD